MTSTQTLIIALWGAGTGTLSLVLAVIAAFQNSRYYLRPRISVHWPDEYSFGWEYDVEPGGVPLAQLVIRNDGSSAARGIRLWLSTTTILFKGKEPWLRIQQLEPGEEYALLVPLAATLSERGSRWMQEDDFRLVWRESPPRVWPRLTLRHADRRRSISSRCANLDRRGRRIDRALVRAVNREERQNTKADRRNGS